MNTLREKLKKSSVDTVSELKIFDLKVAKQRGEVLNLFKAGEVKLMCFFIEVTSADGNNISIGGGISKLNIQTRLKFI